MRPTSTFAWRVRSRVPRRRLTTSRCIPSRPFLREWRLGNLRQRFDPSPRMDNVGSSEIVNAVTSPRSSSHKKAWRNESNGGSVLTDVPIGHATAFPPSQKFVQAGDLLSTVGILVRSSDRRVSPIHFTPTGNDARFGRGRIYQWGSSSSLQQ